MHKLSESYKAVSLIRPQTATATVTGTGVDLLGYLDDALAIVNLGVALTTTETCIVTIQGSNDDSSYTTLTTFATLLGTSDNKLAAGAVNMAGYRYARAVCTIAGTTPSFLISVVLLASAERGKSDLNSLTAA